MSHTLNNNWLIELDTIDSTNNYAMRLIQDGMAHNALVVSANYQTQGKGQRGNVWQEAPSENLAMSIILDDTVLHDLYQLSCAVPIAVSALLRRMLPKCQVDIKWTNDIYVNDKKIAGILIENVFRGSQWKYAVVGIGINLLKSKKSDASFSFTSFFLEGITTVSKYELMDQIRTVLLQQMKIEKELLLKSYNESLWKRGQEYFFQNTKTQQEFTGKILGVNDQFQLIVQVEDQSIAYDFGAIKWIHKKS